MIIPCKTIILSMIYLVVLLSGCSSTIPVKNNQAHQSADGTVIILHGLGRRGYDMRYLTRSIVAEGYKTCVVNYSTLRRSMEQVVSEVSVQIDECSKSAGKVHFVGHSLGGLMTRAYLSNPDHQDIKSKLGQVVMIGTPNHGSAVVDHYQNKWWMKSLGKVTLSLGTGDNSFPLSLPPADFHYGVIAGTRGWYLSDKILGEPNDGLVSVSSTKTETMADFIDVDEGHIRLRKSETVAVQTVHFLRYGVFKQ